MKTHKHELHQYFKDTSKVFFAHTDLDKTYDSDMQKMAKLLDNAIYFNAGDASDLYRIKSVPELYAMPFENMLIEFHYDLFHSNLDKTPKYIVLGVEQYDVNKIKIYHFVRGHNGWHYFGTYYINLAPLPDGRYIILQGTIRYTSEDITNLVHMTLTLITNFLSCINCVNVKQVEHQANRQPGKASTSRKPLYSFWTLEIDKSKNQTMGLPLGGTHASPRIHLRRGHARQYKPGVYCWVQPCLVGKKEAGVIHKDYSLKAA